MKLKKKPLDSKIEGPSIIETEIHRDNRGFFAERFTAALFAEVGIQSKFVQDNHSHSKPGVLRGLHFQVPPQAKLVWPITGKIFDVIVDIRPSSATFLKHTSVTLDSKDSSLMLYIPEGFAHGFCVVGEESSDVIYKVSQIYSIEGESGLIWNDPDLGISWPVKKPLLSERDLKLLTVKQFKEQFAK